MSTRPPLPPETLEDHLQSQLQATKLQEELRQKLLRIPEKYAQLSPERSPGKFWPLWLIGATGMATACGVVGFLLGTQGLGLPLDTLDWSTLAYGSI